MPASHRTPSQERWLRFFNEVLYDALAPAYNALDVLTLGAWWKLVRTALDYVPDGGTILEIGFGPGKLHVHLTRRADLTLGLDLAWGMCRFTQRRLHRAGLPAHITRGSAFALPYRPGSFDAVVSTFALSGLRDALAAVSEMARVTRRGGRVVLVDIGLPSDANPAGSFWARLWERMGDFLYDQPALMRQCGLQLTTLREFGPGRHIRAVVARKT